MELKDIKRLRRLINYSKEYENTAINVKHIIEYNIFISKINSKYNTKIEHLNIKWNMRWTGDAIKWFKNLNLQIKNRINNVNQLQIKDTINKRYSLISFNQC